ncbi:hypothetical protein NMY22_g18464 [Coprinellus aureogranulatus]|nr:hypothetical protein NMY22_g18464 [Coprinellus aureogranulatus]
MVLSTKDPRDSAMSPPASGFKAVVSAQLIPPPRLDSTEEYSRVSGTSSLHASTSLLLQGRFNYDAPRGIPTYTLYPDLTRSKAARLSADDLYASVLPTTALHPQPA